MTKYRIPAVMLSLLLLAALAVNNIVSLEAGKEPPTIPVHHAAAPLSPESRIDVDVTTATSAIKNGGDKDALSIPASFSKSEWVIAKDWLNDRGYVNRMDAEIYKSYSEPMLIELSKHGDLVALDQLTKISLKKNNFKDAIGYLNIAAHYGSTAALDQLTAFTAPGYPQETTEEGRRAAAIETLALTRTIEMRGDVGLAKVSANSFKKSYERRFQQPLELSIAEENRLESRAKEIYEKMESERHKLGLPPFDNGRPTEVDKVYAEENQHL